MQNKKLSPVALTSIIIGVVALIVIIFSISTYNGLAKQEQNVEAKWSEVENKMQRQADLIPSVVSTVKAQMSHEEKIYTALANARKAYNAASTPAAKSKASANIGTMFTALQENYPQLQSSQAGQDLITELEGSQNRISVARGRYIDAVQDYNSAIVTFPRNLFANLMGLHKHDTYKADAKVSSTPKVDFDSGK